MSTPQRVNKAHPCPVCAKDSWCMTGTDIIFCMRVASPRQKTFADGSTAYLHARNGTPLPRPVYLKPQESPINCRLILEKWDLLYGTRSLEYLSKTLGVTRESLDMLGCVKSPQHSVWAFPMRDGLNYIIGIRLRHENGRKWCEPGSHNGLFIPQRINPQSELVITEGPTDCAAAISIGLYAVGRFNCSGGVYMINEFIKERRIGRVMIVADVDNDREINGVTVNPGIQEAMALSELLEVPSCTVTLPTKDMREFVSRGGTREAFNSIVSGLVWRNP